MRGIEKGEIEVAKAYRITPAHAGNSRVIVYSRLAI